MALALAYGFDAMVDYATGPMASGTTLATRPNLDGAAQESNASCLMSPFVSSARSSSSGGCPAPRGRFVVDGDPEPFDGGAVVSLHDSGDPSRRPWPFRATIAERKGRWKLVRIVPQCTSCFGSGLLMNESAECTTCDGSGWGLRQSPMDLE